MAATDVRGSVGWMAITGAASTGTIWVRIVTAVFGAGHLQFVGDGVQVVTYFLGWNR